MGPNLRALLAKGESFRSLKLSVRHWADEDVYMSVLARHRRNPHIQKALGDWAPNHQIGEVEDIYTVWIDRPTRFRQETYDREGRLTRMFGAADGTFWQFSPEVELRLQAVSPTEEIWDGATHPIVSELLRPDFLSSYNPEYPASEPRLQDLGPTTFLERPARLGTLTIADWDSRDPWQTENLWVADDYEFVVDVDLGILLRFACRTQGREFSVREVLDIEVDTPIKSSIFAPSETPVAADATREEQVDSESPDSGPSQGFS